MAPATSKPGIGVTFPNGFLASGVRCGVKGHGRDLAMVVSDRPSVGAGVFTQNLVKASCVGHSKTVATAGQMRAIVVNSGCANCCTGAQGEADTRLMAIWSAEALGLTPEQIAVASTGVIGAHLPMNRIENGIRAAASSLSENGGDAASEAILTTDLKPKLAANAVETPDGWIRIGGIAKGSGMIAPNMATMLAFLTTDAAIRRELLHECLAWAVERSFNSLTVDGDTSTNDMALIIANGASGVATESDTVIGDFRNALTDVCRSLARQIARDGEGATKLISITVSGARSFGEARLVAKTIAESPLVKTAMFGSDPNWGRIVAAAGRSGVDFDPNRLSLRVQGTRLFADGGPLAFDEKAVAQALTRDEVVVLVELGVGEARAEVWTCDLSMDYVRINAEYRT